MQLPFFFTEPLSAPETSVTLNDENSKHIVQVLRMQGGEQIKLTDGLGNIYSAAITDARKKKCTVEITETNIVKPPEKNVCIAISPVKNNSRFEWFLEKATEIGVSEIVPLVCTRTENRHFRYDRMHSILISAMLQSQQAWLTKLHEPIKFADYIESLKTKAAGKFIAHCEEDNKTSLKEILNQSANQLINRSSILIGPEGDFTKEEITMALQNNFAPVSLGNTRLRTETAGMVAATILLID